ncbi:MAG: flagellar biosynthesis protein FlhF [Bacterioplanes sp.]|nr:flagellar biosynthesis protein FlhF [Bacterioplanes sp.]
MKVKRFNAANMQQALRLVSQELGPDAVILSTKKLDQGFEVVAALDYHSDNQQAQQEVERQLHLQRELEVAKTEARQQRTRTASMTTNTTSADSARKKAAVAELASARQERQNHAARADEKMGYDRSLDQVSGELRELKNWLVSHQGSAWNSSRPLTWQQSQLWQRCQDMGLEPVWADRIASHVDASAPLEQSWQQALTMIANDLPVAANDILNRGGRYALVGPTGAGKTTTIGKLAAQFVMHHGAESVALITLDNYRVAAHDQLKTIARLLGVKWYRAPQDGDLDGLLEKTRQCQLVLIDSAGLASRDPHFPAQLTMLKECKYPVTKLLALPLTSQGRCLQENYEHFKSLGLSGCVLTKLDECFCLGPAMSVAALAKLPLTLVTDGPHIPDDIHFPQAEKLVKLAEQMARMARTRWQAADAMSVANQ